MTTKLTGEIKSAEYMACIKSAIESMPTDKRFTKEDVAKVLETTSPTNIMVIGETLLKMSSGHPMSIKRGNRFFCWFGSPRKYYWMEDED